MSDDLDEAVFLFTLPNILSAIKIHGTGEGMRVQLEIPESEMPEAFKLLAMRGCVCEARVTVKLRPDCKTVENNGVGERSIRQSEWTA